ncbi:MAG: glycerophosphodiester phosphodiesterase [bacterium]|nr:glycerophosphodiester phosphodiesterase [bacterium]
MSSRRRPLVIAHRGASGQLPENTLPAYELAIEMASDCIEIDLHRTRDGHLVITHDEELAGLGGEGEIADASLEEIRQLDAGRGERVPTLDEVLDRFGSRIPFNLELKRGMHAAYPGLEAQALAAVTSRGLMSETLFSSFYDPVLKELRALSHGARLALLLSRRFPDGWPERARALGAEALNPADVLVDEPLVQRAHDQGLAVYVFTVDQPERMQQLIDWGVDGVFTNHPDRLRALLGDAGS